MPEPFANLLAKILFKLARWFVLSHSDQSIARRLKIIQRLVYAFSGSEFLRDAIGEAIEIFQEGGRNPEIIRQMLKSTDPEYAQAILKSVLRGR